MQTRQKQRKTISLPGRYFTGLGAPVDAMLIDLSVGGCRFAVGNQTLVPGAQVQIYVGGSGPHRAIVKWTEAGEAGVTFTNPLPDEEFATFRNTHVKVLDPEEKPGDFEGIPDTAPQRFC